MIGSDSLRIHNIMFLFYRLIHTFLADIHRVPTTTINRFSVVALNALYNTHSDVDALQAVVQKRYPSRRPPPSPTCTHIPMQSIQTWCACACEWMFIHVFGRNSK